MCAIAGIGVPPSDSRFPGRKKRNRPGGRQPTEFASCPERVVPNGQKVASELRHPASPDPADKQRGAGCPTNGREATGESDACGPEPEAAPGPPTALRSVQLVTSLSCAHRD